MEAVLSSSSSSPTAVTTTTVSAASANTIPTCVAKIPSNSNSKKTPLALSFTTKAPPLSRIFPISRISSSSSRTVRAEVSSNSTSATATVGINGAGCDNGRWMVLVETPPQELTAKSLIIDYYVSKLERVLGSQKDAQRCIYDASCHTNFGFCCDIDEERARELASVPGVVSVKPDPDIDSTEKDYSCLEIKLNIHSSPFHGSTLFFPAGTTKHWLVRMERPAIGVMRRAQVVDYYVQVLMRVLRSEQDAQMCIYHISWQSNYGFCCELDDECAQELTAVPGVLSVQPDENVESDDKDYAGDNSITSEGSSASRLTRNIKTKKLFVTGLSFYTSEKTLSAAFEGFGELVEVKIIMDKISKRSKGYAFVEYTTEEAASTALREMNGKIINGWMITVDVAKTNPPKYSRGQPRPTS